MEKLCAPLLSYSLADPRGPTPRPSKKSSELEENMHVFYSFIDAAEKQRRIFRLLEGLLSNSRTTVLYVAGKQGVMGIRLSIKDYGIDVAANQKEKKLRIVDSEEWYLTKTRQPTFKSDEEINGEIALLTSAAKKDGFDFATVISETDMLVRKGFFEQYLALEKDLAKLTEAFPIAFLCAYDERELEAKGFKNARSEVSALHSSDLGS